MPFQYRITKYNPKNRDVEGRYLIDEWTCYSDIDKTRSGEILTFEQYIKIENKYVEAIFRFLNCNQICTLKISGLEKRINPKHDIHTTTIMTEVFQKLEDSDCVGENTLDALCRLTIRKFLWCKLESSTLQVHFADDYYIFIVSKSSCQDDIHTIEQSGLFVELYKSPYFVNDAFIKHLNILNGVILYNEFQLDEDWPLKGQEESLREMLQIKFGHSFLIDVGWEPQYDINGYFTVKIIKHYDWQYPVCEIRAKTLPELKIAIEKTAIIIEDAIKNEK